MLCKRAFRRRTSALTLIEVVVVIAILTILAALLLPTVARAKGKVRRVECLTRMKQWAVAFATFAEANDGWIARECYEPLGEVTINNWSQVKGNPQPDGTSDSRDVWYNALPLELSLPPTVVYAAPPDRRRFFNTQQMIHCPAARFPRHVFSATYQFPLFSVAMNSQLIQTGPSIRMSLLEQADSARTVLFLDNLLEGEAKVDPNQENTHLGQPGAYANRFSARHQAGGNLAFVDGHGAWFAGRDVVETRPGPLRGSQILPPRDIVWEIYTF
jgi:prepilin-type processing-associated H-X9-DG protein